MAVLGLGVLAMIFAACAWGYVTVQQAGSGPEQGRWIKLVPLAVLALVLVSLMAADSRFGWQTWVLLGAVLASLVGDHRLATSGDTALKQGMVAFALAHLGYALVLFPAGGWPPVIAFVAFALLAGSTFFWLLPHTGALRLPVVGYIVIISAMGLAAWTASPLNVLIPLGAALFILSDMILSAQLFRWHSSSRLVGLAVLVPYFWGQLALVAGIYSVLS